MEVVLAVGPSRDRTAAVAAALAARDPRVHLVDNPTGRTPAGLNAAIKGSTGEVVVRVDAHSELSPGYVRRAVELLQRTGADNVGGLMLAQGRTSFEKAVACAMSSRLGIGGARFHVGGVEGEAETVYLGVFRRSTLERLGGFDEHFHRAQDWELNHRIRQSGGVVWFSPDLAVTYRPRSSWVELVRQFFHTGRWRREVIRQHPDSIRPRYLAPPAATAAILVGTVAGVVGTAVQSPVLQLGWAGPLGYGVGAVVASLAESRGLPWRARAWFPVVLSTIHLSWGSGFLFGRRPTGRSPR
jgi:glycosyltransferase involved in cell wall biosynthesis